MKFLYIFSTNKQADTNSSISVSDACACLVLRVLLLRFWSCFFLWFVTVTVTFPDCVHLYCVSSVSTSRRLQRFADYCTFLNLVS